MTVPSSLASSQIAADRRQPGEPAEVDRGLGMAGAHEHAAVLGDQREDVAGAHEIGRAHVVVGERPHRVRALLGRDAGRQPVLDVDRDREGGAVRRVVRRHHRIEAQPARLRDRQRRADDAAGVADDERHLLRRAQRGRDDEIALVLAVVVVGDDDDLAAREGLDGFGDGIGHHGFSKGHDTPSPTWARWRRNWSARTQATIASPTGTARMPTQGSWRPLVTISVASLWRVDRRARRQDRGGRLDGEARDDRLPGRDAAEDAAGVVRQEHRRARRCRAASRRRSPRRESSAAAKPSPISTPLTALIDISAAARSASSLP